MSKQHPKQILNTMMDNFKVASSNLIEMEHPFFEENRVENAIYGIAFGKPTKRLSSLLNVDREILIVFTSFASQQARTVKMISKMLTDYKGRLESTVSIVIHPDPRGNINLKEWGRENGVSILPLYYVEDQYPMSPEEFENALCKEIFSLDPFDITGPVSDDNHFYGRRAEALTIARQLQLGQIKATLGIRKIGKTSIINRIIDVINLHYDCYVVMIDCSKDEVWKLSAASMLYSLYRSIGNQIELNEKYISLIPHIFNDEIGACASFFQSQIATYTKPVIIVFDEIDYITPGSPTGKHWTEEFNVFWRNFRSIYQESLRMKKPISVFISGVSSKWFRIESINGIENAALSIVPEDYLGPLPHMAAVSMIRSLGRVVGLQFTENTASYISETCCDSPYWIRKACSYIHKKTEINIRPILVEIATVKTLLGEFILSEGAIIAKTALDHLFRVYPELKQHCKSSFEDKVSEIPKNYIYILYRYGILRETSFRKYALSGEMIREGLSIIFCENSPAVDEKPEALIIEARSEFEEWADELAIINKRRNILEKKLRGIVLNFLRLDLLQNKSTLNVKGRIFKYIEEQKRKKIEPLCPEEIMDKLLWHELCVIIEKEWLLFERVFNDKKLFSLNAGIINDRFDAHAKNVDSADIALYRRSLDWFENCISVI